MLLVTGIVIGALGIETPGGEFEVADICLPGLAPQPSLPDPDPPTMDVDGMAYFNLSGNAIVDKVPRYFAIRMGGPRVRL